MKKPGIFLILFLLGLSSLKATTVSILVVEAGAASLTGSFSSSATNSSALAWENGMMDVFFDAGFIVSNAPSFQTPGFTGEIVPEIIFDLEDARHGGADFFLLIILNYHTNGARNNKDVYIQLFDVSSKELLYEATLTGRNWRNFEEEFQDAMLNAGRIVPQLRRRG